MYIKSTFWLMPLFIAMYVPCICKPHKARHSKLSYTTELLPPPPQKKNLVPWGDMNPQSSAPRYILTQVIWTWHLSVGKIYYIENQALKLL
jgi:hypothetical protein